MALDHINQTALSPTIDTMLLHLSLFGEFCETCDADQAAISATCEFLRDAIEEACDLAEGSCLSESEPRRVLTALHQAEAMFSRRLPEYYSRTRAARGFSALGELLEASPKSDGCRERERRAAALSHARRFSNTLSVFSAARYT